MSKTKNKISLPTVSQIPQKIYEIFIGDKVKVIEDKRSSTRVAHFPFEFTDGTNGIMIICRVKDEPWKPSDDIKKITVLFQ